MSSFLAATNLRASSPPTVASGDGVFLTDTDGRRYLDGCSGAMVANLGHGVTAIEDAIVAQLRQVPGQAQAAREPSQQQLARSVSGYLQL